MLGPALPFRPNARTIRGRSCLWIDPVPQVDAWIKLHEQRAPLFGSQAPLAAPTDRERYADFVARGPKTTRQRVWAQEPERSRIEFEDEDPSMRNRVSVVNEIGHVSWFENERGTIRHGRRWPIDPEKRQSAKFWGSGEDDPAAALLHPRKFFIGLSPIPGSERETRWNNRPAHQIDFVRMIDASTPESVETDDVPHPELDGADRIEFVIDNERNIILEWRCIFEDQVYRRFWFEELEFDTPIDNALFDIDAGPKPPPVVDNRLSRPPDVALMDVSGAILQAATLNSWSWRINGKPSIHFIGEPDELPETIAVSGSLIFQLDAPPPGHANVFFSRFDEADSFCPLPAVPHNATVSGTDWYGTITPVESASRIDMPLPAEAGRYRATLACSWLPPFNSPEMLDGDTPHFHASWIFVLDSDGNESGPPFDVPRTLGFSSVVPISADDNT